MYAENHKARLEIRPANHLDPPRLPKWLRIPFLQPCKGIDNHINLETNLNNRIQTGTGLWKRGDDRMGIDFSIGPVGTLGPIMKSDGDVYVCLTAGHVPPDGDRVLTVKSEDEELEACLHVAERSLRMHGRPRGRVEDGDQAGFQDDVILLEIDDQDKDKFNAVLYCLNCHYYWPDNVSIEEASDPMAHPRAPFLWDAIMSGGQSRCTSLGRPLG